MTLVKKTIISLRRFFVKQNMTKPLHPYERAKVSIYYSIALGLSPVYISRRGKEPELVADLKLHLISCMYVMFYVLLLIGMVGSSDVNIVMQMRNEVFRGIILINSAHRVAASIILNLSCFGRRNQIKLIFENIAEVDIGLRKFGIKRSDKMEVLVQSIHIFFKPVSYIGITALQYWNAPRENVPRSSISNLIIGIYTNILPSLADAQHALLTLATKRNFFDINTYLKKSIKKSTDGNNKHANILTLEEIKLLMRFHDKLCGIASSMNTAFGTYLMTITPFQLGYLLIYLFCAYEALMSGRHLETFCALTQTGIVFCEVFRRLISCHFTCKEAHRTKELVHKVILLERNDRLIKEGISYSASMMIVLYQSSSPSLHRGRCALNITNIRNNMKV